MIAALFVRNDSIYKKFQNVDCYDIDRDALNYKDNYPVICHPPCRAWGQLSHMAKPRPGERELAIYSLNLVRKNGGILEHPLASKLWKEFNLPLGSAIDDHGGWTLKINQSWFGHKAAKSTLLYICGIKPHEIPSYPLCFDVPLYVVSSSKKNNPKKELSKKFREYTPESLALYLLELALLIKEKRNI